MRRLFVAGNWKMNTTLQSATTLAEALRAEIPANLPAVEVAVCPPFPYLIPVAGKIAGSGVTLGAQNAYFEGPGAFTGEVAVEMLLDVGCRYVILGHSERRHVLGETDEIINLKVRASLKKGLDVILCVGEQLSERQAEQTDAVLDTQMKGSLAGVEASDFAKIVIAYEPVWAIGTGLTATPEQAESAHRYLRNWIQARYNSQIAENVRILYGGSVKAENGLSLLQQPDVDGALVGGASLKAEQFLPIVRIADRQKVVAIHVGLTSEIPVGRIVVATWIEDLIAGLCAGVHGKLKFMLSALLSILLLVISLFLMFIILLQRGRGGGLTGALGGLGGQAAFGTKAGDVFTKITVVVATIWIALNCVAIFANRREAEGRYSGRNPAAAGGATQDGAQPGGAGAGIEPGAAGLGDPGVGSEGVKKPEEGTKPEADKSPAGETTNTPPAKTEPATQPEEKAAPAEKKTEATPPGEKQE